MYLSQTGMPGRVSIASYLMRRSIVSKKRIQYLDTILRKSMYTQGDKISSYVSLLAQFFVSGRLTLEAVLVQLKSLKFPYSSPYRSL